MTTTPTRTWRGLDALLGAPCQLCEHRPRVPGRGVCEACDMVLRAEQHGLVPAQATPDDRTAPDTTPEPTPDTTPAPAPAPDTTPAEPAPVVSRRTSRRTTLYRQYRLARARGDNALATELLARLTA